ncbi:hypothetical protein DFJ69_4188 [Thermomonospora umbrina]|uniref:Uncharacterized protein n=1 Tax=Thermomonospora umbrina TaxID=111806 RepID=A0A3D9T0A7_9ACTN|nr:hypothetical protein DFJ69_4188 [Thermomonospora umbrina]
MRIRNSCLRTGIVAAPPPERPFAARAPGPETASVALGKNLEESGRENGAPPSRAPMTSHTPTTRRSRGDRDGTGEGDPR